MFKWPSRKIAASLAVLAIGVPAAVMVYREPHRLTSQVESASRNGVSSPIVAMKQRESIPVTTMQVPPAGAATVGDKMLDGTTQPSAPVLSQPTAAPASAPPPAPKGAAPQHADQKQTQATQAHRPQDETAGGSYGSRFRFASSSGETAEAERDVFLRRLTEAERAAPPHRLSEGARHGSRGGITYPAEEKFRAELQQREQRYHLGSAHQPASQDHIVHPPVDQGRDQFASAQSNPVKLVAKEPVSTFSIDVDTASYALVRRSLNSGRLPPREAVRVEEMINYFPYTYPTPQTSQTPFRPTVTVVPSPWSPNNKLVHIAIKGFDLKTASRPRANLVLLVDISGSMQPADRLLLLKNAFRMLVGNLQPSDSVAIVTYASGSDIRLAPTKVANKQKILSAIDSLQAGGSTNGAAGITDAYKVAEQSFDTAAVNRVILATDGDWNVGITDRGELQKFIERKRETGIYLSILGVGMGNHNDRLMQTLAQNGNGVAAYIDTLNEARKVLVDEASSTLFPIAKDVKIQIEFNPARVASYRLIGYETRALKREDFNNDKVDAGDIGAGHTVTAIYEITPVGQPAVADSLRYQQAPAPQPTAVLAAQTADRRETTSSSEELAFLKMRYKLPKEDISRLIEIPITPSLERSAVFEASDDVRFSVAVAAFGQLLRGLPYLQGYGYDDVIALANSAKGPDPFGYRAEMINLVRLAKTASANHR